jgi:hypothetical protein
MSEENHSNILATVILPAYNEALALPKVLEELSLVLDEQYEVIVVDDGSNDDTANIVAAYPCRLIRHVSNRGKGAAVRTGIRYARGENIIIMDADATYPVDVLPKIVELLKENDVVRCIRQQTSENMPLINKVGNWIFDFLMKNVGLDSEDQLSGLYGLRRDKLLNMNLEADGFDLEAEVSIKARTHKLKAMTFPIVYHARLGEKKLRPWQDGWHILSRIIFMALIYNPVITFILPGIIIMALAITGAIVLRDVPIPTPIFGMGVHSFILASMGILGGFQLITFGITAALYGVEVGRQPSGWLVKISSLPVRMGAAFLGIILTLYNLLRIVISTVEWVSSKAYAFTATQSLVFDATILVWGLQLISAALFISIFSGRLKNKTADVHLV